ALSGLKAVGASLAEIKEAANSIFNDPIKGFGVLSGYTQRRFSQATGIGADRIRSRLHPRLEPLTAGYEKYTTELASVADELLRRYGKSIADRQYAQKRIADVMIDLFVGLCVLSRADSLVKSNPETADQVVSIATAFARQA